MTKNEIGVLTIIVTWNSKKFIDKSIKSLQKSTYPTDILVVDNISADKTDEYVKKKYKDISVLQTGKNLGFAGAVNAGIKKALKQKYKYIFLLNPDAFIDSRCLKNLITEMEANKQIGMSCPKIYYNEPANKIWYAGSDIEWGKGFTPHTGDSQIDTGQYNKKRFMERVCGCAVLIRSSAIKKVGLMDETYFLYFEETDLSMKFSQKGFKHLFVPNAKCWHITSSSTGGYFSPLYQYYMTRNNLVFMNKFGRKYFKSFIVHLIIRCVISILRNLKRNPMNGIKVARSIVKAFSDYSNNNLGKQNYV